MKDIILSKIYYVMTFAVDKPNRADLGIPDVAADENFFKDILAITFGVAGAVAVLIIIIGALNITKSNGDPESISKAKKTVAYALVGLAVCISAEMIVFFVLGRL